MKRLIALVPFLATPGFAQCVMCFRTAAAQQVERARVLNLGIVLLGLPPFLILAGFCWLIYRRSETFRDRPYDPPGPCAASTRESTPLEVLAVALPSSGPHRL